MGSGLSNLLIFSRYPQQRLGELSTRFWWLAVSRWKKMLFCWIKTDHKKWMGVENKDVGSQKKDGLFRGTFALQPAATKDLGQFTL